MTIDIAFKSLKILVDGKARRWKSPKNEECKRRNY